MQQISKDMICKYCFGCNKLELESFNGTRNCRRFIPAFTDWRSAYDKAIKEKYGGKKLNLKY